MQSKKDWAKYHDNRLFELAMYHLSEGLVVPVTDREKLYEKFAEFKGLVVRGSFTIKQLEESVYGQYGIMPDRSDAEEFIHHLQAIAEDELEKKDEESS